MREDHDSYVAHCHDCGGIIAACVDSPDRTKRTATFVHDLMKRGYAIHRMLSSAVRAGTWCACGRPIADPPQDPDLFHGTRTDSSTPPSETRHE